ncbi:unnamed protein product [Brassica oleracea]|uniref:Uncharacterized protein n=1 Tax=Brassica oleracea TaxID=3712 RepID=A0A3P6B4T3_BRAOL|nr:unnamed protein product [Brassica oleracea]
MFLEDSVLYNIQNLTPTSPELDVKKPQDIVRPGSLSL